MTPTLPRLLVDTLRLFRREAALVVAIAAPLIFLPAFAAQLLCDPPPAWPAGARDEAAMAAWLQAVAVWGRANAVWYIAADAVALLGAAAIALLLLDPARPDVAGALRTAAQRYWRFAAASILAAIPIGLGLWLLVLPGLWFQARLIAVLPALAADARLAAGAALTRSWVTTRGLGWVATAAVVTFFLAQWLALGPLVRAEAWLRVPAHNNPFLIALIVGLQAAVTAVYRVAILLLGIVLYRRRASIGT